jgi:thiol-disulfide isomerase/thioredoxin
MIAATIRRRSAIAGLVGWGCAGALGLSAADVAAAGRAWLGLELAADGNGVVARRVLRGSPAETAGLQAGDTIVAFDGRPMASPREVIESVASAGAGVSVTLTIRRGGVASTRTAVLAAHPGDEGVLRLEHVGLVAPSVGAIRTVQGAEVDPAKLRGRVVLVEFWASWCAACRLGAPAIEAVRVRYEAQGLAVVALTDDTAEVAAKALAKHGLRCAVGAELSPDASRAWSVRVLPTMFVLDRQGVVREAFVGTRSADALGAAVEPLLRAR